MSTEILRLGNEVRNQSRAEAIGRLISDLIERSGGVDLFTAKLERGWALEPPATPVTVSEADEARSEDLERAFGAGS